MEHNIHSDNGVTILDLSGEIDVSQAPKLRETLVDLLEKNAGRLLVNMTEVIYIDSAGLSVLIAANRKAQTLGGSFALCNPQKPVQQVFKLTRMNKVFQIFPTVAEGVTGLNEA
ncbi:MAG: STAS domain-containing protein [Anaerolineae bacterium]|nr:STAS domain-containing protein [Anaerolineae bacterium]